MRLMGLKLIILDEADYLLDLGFRKDIEKIVDCIPRQRQSLLFSATMPKEVISFHLSGCCAAGELLSSITAHIHENLQ